MVFKNDITCSILSLDITNYGILEMDIFGTSKRLVVDMVNHTVDNYVISKKKSLIYKQIVPKKFPITKKIDEPIVSGLKHLLKCMSENNSQNHKFIE